MKSICIKTNNQLIAKYILDNIEQINLENIYISILDLKHYSNIVIHCKNNNIIAFCSFLSNILTKIVITFYEDTIIKENINLYYFYFDIFEKKKILEYSKKLLNESNNKYDLINNCFYEYIINNHSIYLQSFIDFNLYNYTNSLKDIIDMSVNKFLVDKEYLEFVNILRLYIKSESLNSNLKHLHLIYPQNKKPIIVDDNNNIINSNNKIKKISYVSDISFSENDLALNSLLELMPKQITVHLVNTNCDEFINTLKLIFQEKIKICNECDICKIYHIKDI